MVISKRWAREIWTVILFCPLYAMGGSLSYVGPRSPVTLPLSEMYLKCCGICCRWFGVESWTWNSCRWIGIVGKLQNFYEFICNKENIFVFNWPLVFNGLFTLLQCIDLRNMMGIIFKILQNNKLVISY